MSDPVKPAQVTRPASSEYESRENWRCPVCGSSDGQPKWPVNSKATEGGVDPRAFRPSSDKFGSAVGEVVRCRSCGHGFVSNRPPSHAVSHAYSEAIDPVSLREEAGQVATADRALVEIERWLRPGRLLDIGCWTGSLLVAAKTRGWEPEGIEPSTWAASRASERGVEVHHSELGSVEFPAGRFRLVTLCDVLEHLTDPGEALNQVAEWVEPGGGVYITVPDAGSALARLLGRRWWSVLPMHLQYFTRESLARLLTDSGLTVRSVHSHAKVFTARYYAERLAGYNHLLESAAVTVTRRLHLAERLVAPDFHDRVAAVAIK